MARRLSCAFKPLHYLRYVDDSFVFFGIILHDRIIPFLEYLNSEHFNIKFAYEIAKDHCLPSLDVNIIRHPFTGSLRLQVCLLILIVLFRLINTLLFRRLLLFFMLKLKNFKRL